jgi:hypothetical protein
LGPRLLAPAAPRPRLLWDTLLGSSGAGDARRRLTCSAAPDGSQLRAHRPAAQVLGRECHNRQMAMLPAALINLASLVCPF